MTWTRWGTFRSTSQWFSGQRGGLGAKKSGFNSSSVQVVNVEAVLGHRATLPCDISANRTDDRVQMVMWFQVAASKPLFTSSSFDQNICTVKRLLRYGCKRFHKNLFLLRSL
ncbi:Matrix remodeling-associated protein 8 [Frankliniella fusca]|uniref:Matrix remodeling-associated protein 8 n=1 Tax=Frankliniella fusca TaxID=407009 RepID=A0AAE1HQM4_9NEOP|nr:Matrix remodeling-associated protein 8 [Frankliniella fusca]